MLECSHFPKAFASLLLLSGKVSEQTCFPRGVLFDLCYTYMVVRTTSRNCNDHFIDIKFWVNNGGTLIGPLEITIV